MADNISVSSGIASYNAAADIATYSGDADAAVQVTHPVFVSGSEGSKTVSEIAGATGSPAAAAMSVHALPATSGGCSTYHVVSAASANAANIKSSAGQIFGARIFNNAAYPIFVKFHNTSGAPTAGSGVVRVFGIQAGVGLWADFPMGLAFSTGIGISIVKDLADSGTTAVAASDCVVDVDYK